MVVGSMSEVRVSRRGRDGLFLQLFCVALLLLLHILQARGDSRLEICVFLLRITLRGSGFARAVHVRLWLGGGKLRPRHVSCSCMAFAVFQAHLQGTLQVSIEAVLGDSSAPGLHPLWRGGAAHARGLPQAPFATCWALRAWSSSALFRQLHVAAVVHAHGLHDAQVWQGQVLARTGAAEDAAAVSTVVLAVGKSEFLATAQADVTVGPLGRGGGVEHAAGHVLLGRKADAVVLERSIGLGDVGEAFAALSCGGPVLDELEDLGFDMAVALCIAAIAIALPKADDADQVVDELAAGYLGHEVRAAVFDAGVGQVKGGELDVGVLVANAAFQAAHSLSRLHCLAADNIADFEVEGDVFERAGRRAFDLCVQLAVGRVAKPRRHDRRLQPTGYRLPATAYSLQQCR